jgi:tol-pal system beta propeller repeat protein TolB
MKKEFRYIASIVLISGSLAMGEQQLESQKVVEEPLQVHVAATDYTRVGIKIIAIGNDEDFTSFISILKNDLSFSGQFTISASLLDQVPNRSFFTAVAKEGYPLTLILEKKGDDAINWRLYDTGLGQMVKGQTHPKKENTIRGWAHALADIVWPELTGKAGFFSTKIAYCKAVHLPHKKSDCRYICVADYDGSNEQLLVKTPTINLAPRWNRDSKKPLLFYSEYTSKNIRLMAVDMKGRRRIASNFDGINMLPTFSADGKKCVYCASRADGNCHLYYFEKSVLKRLLSADGNHVSPSLSADGSHMYFCSDYETGKPHIYRYDFENEKITRITEHGSAMAPSYSSAARKVVYSKFVHDVVQLFCYDEVTGKHAQITTDKGNKDEASWSPCGNYLLFSVDKGRKGRVAQLNLLTKELRYITGQTDDCTYPIWSDRYDQFPVIA